LFPESGEKVKMSDSEMKLVSQFNGRGNGMLLSLGNRQGNSYKEASVNSLSSQYGVHFVDRADNKPRIMISMASQFLNSASELLGRFLKIVHKA
jgi:hypothetical protein